MAVDESAFDPPAQLDDVIEQLEEMSRRLVILQRVIVGGFGIILWLLWSGR